MDFKPDGRKTTYKVFNQEKKIAPKVIFSITALKWIHALIEAHSGEVGFYAIVDEPEENTYYIRDVFYPKHSEANGATCEISAEGETDVMEWLIENGRENDITKMKFWGHLHSGFTSPSGQDETQAYELMNRRESYIIRAICMKGEISISFFDYENQIRFDNIEWTTEEKNSHSALTNKMDKIKEIVNNDGQQDVYDSLVEIYNTIREDQEMEEIEQKVKKLKEENMPTVKTYGRSGGSQQNLFNHTGPTSNIARVTCGQDDSNDILDEKELANLMNDVEYQITEFNKTE